MPDLLIPPLALDDRSRAIDALAARMTGLDLTPILVYLIDLAPADALPILAEQFNVVGPLWAYLPDEAAKRLAIKESVAWHRAKGTPWSVETALSWAGHVAKVEDTTGSERRWAEYQLELAVPVSEDSLSSVLELARFAAPARSHLVRLYGGYDLRSFRLDFSRLDDALLDDDSGVWQGDVKLSFGTRHALQITAEDMPVDGGMTRQYSTRVWDDDSWRLDAWRLDSEILIDAASGMVSQQSAAIHPDADEPPVGTRLEFRTTALSPDIESPDIAGRIDQRASALTDEVRGWTGPWTGTWREPIPSRTTFEDA